MLKVTKAWETSKNYNKKYCKIIITNTVEHIYIFSKKYCLFPPPPHKNPYIFTMMQCYGESQINIDL